MSILRELVTVLGVLAAGVAIGCAAWLLGASASHRVDAQAKLIEELRANLKALEVIQPVEFGFVLGEPWHGHKHSEKEGAHAWVACGADNQCALDRDGGDREHCGTCGFGKGFTRDNCDTKCTIERTLREVSKKVYYVYPVSSCKLNVLSAGTPICFSLVSQGCETDDPGDSYSSLHFVMEAGSVFLELQRKSDDGHWDSVGLPAKITACGAQAQYPVSIWSAEDTPSAIGYAEYRVVMVVEKGQAGGRIRGADLVAEGRVQAWPIPYRRWQE